jgi:hypothetical protein
MYQTVARGLNCPHLCSPQSVLRSQSYQDEYAHLTDEQAEAQSARNWLKTYIVREWKKEGSYQAGYSRVLA